MARQQTWEERRRGSVRPRSTEGLGASITTGLLGAWLFSSAFLWPHTPAAAINAAVVGGLVIAAALLALRVPVARWLNTALAFWLAFSTLLIAQEVDATVWSNLLVAAGVLACSFVPVRERPPQRPRTV